MLVDEFNYELPGKCQDKSFKCELKKAVSSLEKKIKEFSKNFHLRFERKTVIEQHDKTKKLSSKSLALEEELVHIINKNHQLTDVHKIKSYLKQGGGLNRFKRALKKLNIIENNNKDSFQTKIWTIALHATKNSWRNVVKKLWLKISGYKSLKLKKAKEDFDSFINDL